MVNNGEQVRIEDWQLLAYLDGELDTQTTAIIESSEAYLGRAKELRGEQNRLKAQLHRIDCPEAMELGEYELGYLKRKRAKAIERHLSECPTCRRELEQLKAFLKAETPQVKPALWDGVKVLVARVLGQMEDGSTPGGFRLSPAYATVRGGSQGPVTLEADGVLILLEFQPSDEGGVSLLGQVAADDQERWTGAKVDLRRENELILTTALDDLGAFRGEGLYPGVIELSIIPEEGPVILANVEIRDE